MTYSLVSKEGVTHLRAQTQNNIFSSSTSTKETDRKK